MNSFVPTERPERVDMLQSVGLPDPDKLLDQILKGYRLRDLPVCPVLDKPLEEMEVVRRIRSLAGRSYAAAERICFLGAGSYDHYQPAAVRALTARQEFSTAYTPYQPEISQGTLQGIFEFQSLVCRMTGLDVANSSMYDGASAAAEALLMACRVTGRSRCLVAGSVHPRTRAVIETYFAGSENQLAHLPVTGDGALTTALAEIGPDDRVAAVLVQSPNFYGQIEDLKAIAEIAHAAGALAIASCDLLSLSLLIPPGEAGFDIAIGEIQSLGLPLSFGGPYAGYMACRQDLMRKMPGRICGETVDRDGRRAFVLTIQAREQHIRREKATSNICTNQALCALATTIHAALLGSSGLKSVAEQSARGAFELKFKLIQTGWFDAVFPGHFFREFAVRLVPERWTAADSIQQINRYLSAHGVVGGLDLETTDDVARIEGGWLLAVTEKRRPADLDRLVQLIAEFRHERGLSDA